MKKPCAFCERTRLGFIWVIVFGIMANAAYNFFYFRETLTVFQIIKIPLLLCIIAFFIKTYNTWRK